jgi:hypothetical protein
VIVFPAAVKREQLLEALAVLGLTVPDQITEVTIHPDRIVVDWLELEPYRAHTITLQVVP